MNKNFLVTLLSLLGLKKVAPLKKVKYIGRNFNKTQEMARFNKQFAKGQHRGMLGAKEIK